MHFTSLAEWKLKQSTGDGDYTNGSTENLEVDTVALILYMKL